MLRSLVGSEMCIRDRTNTPNKSTSSSCINYHQPAKLSTTLSATSDRVSQLSTALDKAIAQLSRDQAPKEMAPRSITWEEHEKVTSELQNLRSENLRLQSEMASSKQRNAAELGALKVKLARTTKSLHEAIEKGGNMVSSVQRATLKIKSLERELGELRVRDQMAQLKVRHSSVLIEKISMSSGCPRAHRTVVGEIA
eukprot:TRINITY_DN1475_c0_g1_i2.p1 TRINITY_DN1475_c0_g1~~TRINITY_DN1475_c0_g1_i2.p1  ORF type:complete len:197 (+),score=57.73 TRINITY_DN1475_c0_g1_i2:150-740(+)